MDEFFITIWRDGKKIDLLDKLPIDLNTAGNLVTQAEDFVNKQLNNLGVEQNFRSQYSWKVSRKKPNGFGKVTISRNWEGP
jgi:hypothetical protein